MRSFPIDSQPGNKRLGMKNHNKKDLIFKYAGKVNYAHPHTHTPIDALLKLHMCAGSTCMCTVIQPTKDMEI